jgi:hypothetical protein
MERPMTRSRFLTVLMIVAAVLAARGPLGAQSPSPVAFNDFFVDKALRFNLYQAGDAKEEDVVLDRIYEEPVWPESRTHLIEPFNYGRYVVKLYDVASNRLIYTRGFDTTFAEYKTTTPALDGVKRVFQRSLRVPEPQRTFLFVVEARDKYHLLHPLFKITVDPSDYHIIREPSAAGGIVYEAQKNGDPHEKVDLTFIAEGYTAADLGKFKADVDRLSAYLFTVAPYKSRRERFNVRGVFHPSPERAMDEPRQRVYRNTLLKASFNAFDLDRYMLIEEDFRMHEIAAEAPTDAIVVLVNSKRYGGGSIAFDYCVSTVDNAVSPQVMVHELGHSFAGLADEYYASEVSYNDFYPKGVEPLEPNITALLDPANVKWKGLLSPGISIPTEYGKDEIDALEAERRKNRRDEGRALEDAKKRGVDAVKLERIEATYRAADTVIGKKIEAVNKRYASLEDKVGVFEGAGYSSKGLYRSQIHCIMISSPTGEFCKVCQRAIAQMIDYFGEDR